jgi:KaiC/GvpD/RAD55 family RecA-like ATPase
MAAPGSSFTAQFYRDDASLVGIVAAFLVEGLTRGEPAILIATAEHQAAILAAFPPAVDVEAHKRFGELVVLDARDTLDALLVDDVPHPDAFKQIVGTVIEQVGRGRESSTVRVYGDMINLLWQSGRYAAATRLETFWNEMSRSRTVNVMFGYSMGHFYKGTTAASWSSGQ